MNLVVYSCSSKMLNVTGIMYKRSPEPTFNVGSKTCSTSKVAPPLAAIVSPGTGGVFAPVRKRSARLLVPESENLSGVRSITFAVVFDVSNRIVLLNFNLSSLRIF